MGMSSYVMDIEEQFIDKCADIAIDSESFEEYANRTMKVLNMVPHLSGQEISDIIDDVYFEMTAQLGGK